MCCFSLPVSYYIPYFKNKCFEKETIFFLGNYIVIKCMLLSFPVLCVSLSGTYSYTDSEGFIAV